jgi:hypothetical protein
MCYFLSSHIVSIKVQINVFYSYHTHTIYMFRHSFTPLLHYLVSLRAKYLPQHPILEHAQATSLPLYERPSFTPIQNKRQNYNSVYLDLYIFGQPNGRPKSLPRMLRYQHFSKTINYICKKNLRVHFLHLP